jgi:Zn finger protein HypA/HybF involved in hydrogenase expression
MHEFHLMTQIVKAVEARLHEMPGAKPLVIRLKVQPHSHLLTDDPATLTTAFALAAHGTLAQGAALDILSAFGEGWCPHCQRRAAAGKPEAPCPFCGLDLRPAEEGPEVLVHELVVET